MGWTKHQTGWTYHLIPNLMDGNRKFFTYKNTNSTPEVIESITLRLGAGNGTFDAVDTVEADGSSYTVYAHGTGSDGTKRTSETFTISNKISPTSGGYPSTPLASTAARTFIFDVPIYVAPGASVIIYLNIQESKSGSTMIYDRDYIGSSVVGGSVVKICNSSGKWLNAVPHIYNGSKWIPATAYVYNSGWKVCTPS